MQRDGSARQLKVFNLCFPLKSIWTSFRNAPHGPVRCQLTLFKYLSNSEHLFPSITHTDGVRLGCHSPGQEQQPWSGQPSCWWLPWDGLRGRSCFFKCDIKHQAAVSLLGETRGSFARSLHSTSGSDRKYLLESIKRLKTHRRLIIHVGRFYSLPSWKEKSLIAIYKLGDFTSVTG